MSTTKISPNQIETATPKIPERRASLESQPDRAEVRPLCGSLDILTATSACGWAYNPDSPGCAVTIEILVNNELLVSTVADGYRADLQKAQLGSGHHAYQSKLPKPLKRNDLVSIRIADLDLYIVDTLPFVPEPCGAVDLITSDTISGWIDDPAQDEAPIVVLMVEGHEIARCTADLYRYDLELAGIRTGYRGFHFHFPGWMKDGLSRTVTLTAPNTNYTITQIPIVYNTTAIRHFDVQAHHHLSNVLISGTWVVNTDAPFAYQVRINDHAYDILPVIDQLGHATFDLTLCAATARESPITIELLTSSDKIHFGLSARTSCKIAPITQIRFDIWKSNTLIGWGRDLGAPDQILTFDVLINDVTALTRIRATLHRTDLLKAGIGDGCHGFALDLSAFCRDTAFTIKILHTLSNHTIAGPLSIIPNVEHPLPANLSELASQHTQRVARHNDIYRLGKSPPPSRPDLSVIVPIYNAPTDTAACLQSIFENTDRNVRLIFIDDASTDPTIQTLLSTIVDAPNVVLLRNETNLGFTATVNNAIAEVPNDDVIILNSDTIVSPKWERNLRIAAYSAPNVGTATALSDNAGAFSVPETGTENELPTHFTTLMAGRAVTRRSNYEYPSIPTGNGFCMYIRRDMLNAVGVLDVDAFPRGYGEENDLCMRAGHIGWRHVLDDATWVKHTRSASFGDEKHALMARARRLIDDRYPEYATQVRAFVRGNPLLSVKHAVRSAHSETQISRRRLLTVTSTEGGGTPQTNADLMNALSGKYECFNLRCDKKTLTVSLPDGTIYATLAIRQPLSLTNHTNDEYAALLRGLLLRLDIDIVHVRHFMWHDYRLPTLCFQLNIPCILSFHDYYSVCPSVNLITPEGDFCGGKCPPSSTDVDCVVPGWPADDAPHLCNKWIHTWQTRMQETLAKYDAFVAASASSKAVIVGVYPDLARRPFHVIPHGRDFPHLLLGPTLLGGFLKSGEKLRVLLPGNLNRNKGLDLARAIKALDNSDAIEFHFLGKVEGTADDLGVIHGPYERGTFERKVKQIQPHLAAILSITAETWSHTLTEAWSVGLPVLATDLGAPSERIRKSGGGWVVQADPHSIYLQLMDIRNSSKTEEMKRLSEVVEWQSDWGLSGTLGHMAAQYDLVYRQALQSTRRDWPGRKPTICVGVMLLGTPGNHPPSAHVRILSRLTHPEAIERLVWRHVSVPELLGGQINPTLDVLLLHRNAVSSEDAPKLISMCRSLKLPIVYDLDDNLLDVPAEKDPAGMYSRARDSVEAFLREATVVLSSTRAIADIVKEYNSNVVIIQNQVDEQLWLTDTTRTASARGTPRYPLRMLCVAGVDRMQEIRALREAIEPKVKAGQLSLTVVGPSSEQTDWYTTVQAPDKYRSYPRFAHWLTHMAEAFDVGLAPLNATPFNDCKSDLKVLDYACCHLPTLASNTSAYSSTIRNGITGLLVNNTTDAWSAALDFCLQHPDELLKMGERAYTYIRAERRLSDSIQSWIALFDGAASLDTTSPPACNNTSCSAIAVKKRDRNATFTR